MLKEIENGYCFEELTYEQLIILELHDKTNLLKFHNDLIEMYRELLYNLVSSVIRHLS
ncbi:hypothetical protein NUACC26_061930 [Scytonema sp. NUACC26]